MPAGELDRGGPGERADRAVHRALRGRSTATARRSRAPAPRSDLLQGPGPRPGPHAPTPRRSLRGEAPTSAPRDVYWRELGGFARDRHLRRRRRSAPGATVAGPGDRRLPGHDRGRCRPGAIARGRPARQRRDRRRGGPEPPVAAAGRPRRRAPATRPDAPAMAATDDDQLGRHGHSLHPARRARRSIPSLQLHDGGRRRRSIRSPTRSCATRCGTSTSSTAQSIIRTSGSPIAPTATTSTRRSSTSEGDFVFFGKYNLYLAVRSASASSGRSRTAPTTPGSTPATCS